MVGIERIGISEKGAVSLQDLLDLAKRNPNLMEGGAIATFTGIVRGYTHSGEEVQKLEVEAHMEEAGKALARISEELRAKPGVVDVIIHHLVGEFNVGEDLVYVVIIGRSRSDVFRTLEEAVEEYKKKAAIWKKEYLKDGSSHWTTE